MNCGVSALKEFISGYGLSSFAAQDVEAEFALWIDEQKIECRVEFKSKLLSPFHYVHDAPALIPGVSRGVRIIGASIRPETSRFADEDGVVRQVSGVIGVTQTGALVKQSIKQAGDRLINLIAALDSMSASGGSGVTDLLLDFRSGLSDQ